MPQVVQPFDAHVECHSINGEKGYVDGAYGDVEQRQEAQIQRGRISILGLDEEGEEDGVGDDADRGDRRAHVRD